MIVVHPGKEGCDHRWYVRRPWGAVWLECCKCGEIQDLDMAGIRRGVLALREDRVTPWQEVKQELGLE